MTDSTTRILISAGEASGERYGAMLMEAMRALRPELDFFGLGGEGMKAAGFDAVIESREVAVVGLAEVVRRLPGIYRQFQKLVAEAEQRKPAAAVLIDFPDFNLRLARQLTRRGIPVVYFVSPQLWAWRPSRIKQVKKYVRKMLVIFPFEQEFYRQQGVEAEFVGHPLAEITEAAPSREAFAREYALDAAKPWIALLPGSRTREIEMNLPEMVRAAQILGAGFEYLLPAATTIDAQWLASLLKEKAPRMTVVSGATRALALSRAAVVASGTATLEAALVGNPFVVVYRVAPLTYAMGKRLVNVERYAMPNLIAGKEIVPELIQGGFKAENVVGALRPLLDEGGARVRMQQELAQVRRKLLAEGPGGPAATRAARAVLEFVDAK